MVSHKWEPISQLDENFSYDFSQINSLRRRWIEFRERRETADPHAYTAFIARLIRSWAIETGIIEGLYTLDQGMTETLVANGISADLIERSSTNKDPQELAQILADHQATVAAVYRSIREGRPITISAIRQIHSAIAEHQPTYRAFNPTVGWFNATLEHGAFKRLPNNPTRPDGTLHEYCPPEQVDSELDNLLKWYGQYLQDINRYHPLLTAAWLHHRFTQIHPFTDGNGRVVRALLTWHLVRENYLPVVISRDDRLGYISALEDADAGKLTPFVDLLAKLQRRTILAAIGEREPDTPDGAFDQVLAHISEQIQRQTVSQATQMRAVNEVAQEIRDLALDLMRERGEQVSDRLTQSGLKVDSRVLKDSPGERENRYYRQIVQTANNSNHWVNFNESRFFARLSLTPDDITTDSSQRPRLHFVVSLHHTGRQLSGLMAATAFALIVHYDENAPEQLEGIGYSFFDCTREPFTFSCDDDASTLSPRFEEWTEQGLAMALRHWGEFLS